MTEEEYKQQIRQLDWDGLWQLWQTIQQGYRPHGWAAGKAFEYAVLRAFELDRATVRYPFTVAVEGQTVEQLDGVIHVGALSCLIESKDYATPILLLLISSRWPSYAANCFAGQPLLSAVSSPPTGLLPQR